MEDKQTTATNFRSCMMTIFCLTLLPLAGCGPNYYQLRVEGQKAMLSDMYGAARIFFQQADARNPRQINNLHDLGACSVLIAREKFKNMEQAPALRDLDRAIDYYSSALDIHPGHQAAIEGKMVALKLKGQFDKAIEHAEWAAKFVGPSSKQYLFLANELEESGDIDNALLRYRQGVAVDSNNPDVHITFARFLIRHNNEPAAIHHMQVAYRLNPRNEWVMDQLADRGVLPPLASTIQPTP